MNHLTEEQFEDILQGNDQGFAHLNECGVCRQKLADKRLIADRLRTVFESVKPDKGLEEKIRNRISDIRRSQLSVSGDRWWKSRLNNKIWSSAAAAAVVFAVVFPLYFYLSVPSEALAGQAELVRIHEHNLSPHTEFYSETEPEKLAVYLKEILGFSPAMPKPDQGLAVRGCCIAHFKGEITGSYVVSTPKGTISVIVVPDRPEELALDRMADKNGYRRTFWKSSYAHCNMVAVSSGEYTYSAVGNVLNISHEYLRDLLGQLLSDSHE